MGPVAGAQRRRPQHVVVVAPAQVERQLDRLRARARDGRGSRPPPRAAGGSAGWLVPRRSKRWPSASRSSKPRMAQATSFTCCTTPSWSTTTRPSSMLSITASSLACASSTASMRGALDRDRGLSGHGVEELALRQRENAAAVVAQQRRARRPRRARSTAARGATRPRAACRCRGRPAGRARTPRWRSPRSGSGSSTSAGCDARAVSRPPSGSRRTARAPNSRPTCSTITRRRSSTLAAAAISRAKA